ncbi:hypothetical protein K456DRAFT_1933495 [Colletotrichum gloeosporioides 23]|nr:hypothetical protein K456DRAFT_1933495 [Colletotrichum gloeosporioides 23]
MVQQDAQSEKLASNTSPEDIELVAAEIERQANLNAVLARRICQELQSDEPLTEATMNLNSWAVRRDSANEARQKYIIADAGWFGPKSDTSVGRYPSRLPERYSKGSGQILLVPINFDVSNNGHWSLMIVHDGFTGFGKLPSIKHLDPFRNTNTGSERGNTFSIDAHLALESLFIETLRLGQWVAHAIRKICHKGLENRYPKERFDSNIFREEIFREAVSKVSDVSIGPHDPEASLAMVSTVEYWKSGIGEFDPNSLAFPNTPQPTQLTQPGGH